MVLGATGVISVSANILPREVSQQCAQALAGNWSESRKIHERLYDLTKLLFIESNPVPIKAAMEMMGLIGPEIRLPLSPIGDGNRQTLRAEMVRMGLRNPSLIKRITQPFCVDPKFIG
jgi:4-hydroxy-tetrahydrodipicolinate synthase